VPSVASVFVSRWDKAADALLPQPLHGRLGLAVTEKVLASNRSLLSEDRWLKLAAGGGRPQRVLWASTSTKDPAFPDTYYLGKLAARGTIDTVPEKTLLAYVDHGGPVELMDPDFANAQRCIAQVASTVSMLTRSPNPFSDREHGPSRPTGPLFSMPSRQRQPRWVSRQPASLGF
jgi:transaldolase